MLINLTLVLTVICGSTSAIAGIDSVRAKAFHFEQLAQQYEAASRAITPRQVGEASDKTFDVKGHTCGVLGELLGLGSNVASGWTYPDPGIDSRDPDQLWLYAVSLINYVRVADDLLKESDFAWRYIWNLNCSGNYNSSKWYKFEEGSDYTLVISDDKRSIHIIGNIKPGLLDALAKRLVIHRSIKRIELSSGGGLAHEAMKIGRLIRQRQLTTVVRDNCNSACTLLFIGGVERLVPAPYYDLGFHRASERGGTVSDFDFVYDDIKVYAEKMISDGETIVQFAHSGTRWDYYRPSAKLLCETGIATWVEDVCGRKASD